jgi:uncharacterized protein
MGGFDWDEHNIAHIARHDVTPAEVEELFNRHRIIEPASIEGYFYAYGTTGTGRHLVVVFTYRKDGLVRPATAYPMNRSKRKLYGPQLKKPE